VKSSEASKNTGRHWFSWQTSRQWKTMKCSHIMENVIMLVTSCSLRNVCHRHISQ